MFLEILQKSQEKTFSQVKRLWYRQVLPVNFVKFLRTSFIIKQLCWLLLILWSLFNLNQKQTLEILTVVVVMMSKKVKVKWITPWWQWVVQVQCLIEILDFFKHMLILTKCLVSSMFKLTNVYYINLILIILPSQFHF